MAGNGKAICEDCGRTIRTGLDRDIYVVCASCVSKRKRAPKVRAGEDDYSEESRP
jgi:DNA-directed RNA polymerase subunit RPC12/RpoP